jgi:hypothetical protein
MQQETKEIFQTYKFNPITGENEFSLEIKHNNHPVRRVTGTSETVKGAATAASPRMIITQTLPRKSTEIIDSDNVFGYIKKLIDAAEEQVEDVAEVEEPRATKKIKIRTTKSKKSRSKSKSKSVSR